MGQLMNFSVPNKHPSLCAQLSSVREQVRRTRQEGATNNKRDARASLKERVANLKAFSRGISTTQLSDIKALEQRDFVASIRNIIDNRDNKIFFQHELYDLLIDLSDQLGLGSWKVHFGCTEAVLYCSYGSVYPGIRFVKEGHCNLRCTGCSYNIRLRD